MTVNTGNGFLYQVRLDIFKMSLYVPLNIGQKHTNSVVIAWRYKLFTKYCTNYDRKAAL